MDNKKKMMSNLEEIWENVHFKLRTAGLTEMYAELLSYIGEDSKCGGEGEETERGCFVCCVDGDGIGEVYHYCLLDSHGECAHVKGRFTDKKDCPFWRKR